MLLFIPYYIDDHIFIITYYNTIIINLDSLKVQLTGLILYGQELISSNLDIDGYL